ncbi:hypothetical protein [Flavobacterium sp.]|jgi:hypothetical protein|uniref:hypothetical protein n=1 Tax=Flavobacterium sp. TaxID=239 RepID=UPI0037BF539D
MRKANDVFSILMVIFVAFAVWKYQRFSQQEKRFGAEQLGVALTNHEKIWGKPDSSIKSNGLVLFYDSENGLGHRYVFRFDDNEKLAGKYYDD